MINNEVIESLKGFYIRLLKQKIAEPFSCVDLCSRSGVVTYFKIICDFVWFLTENVNETDAANNKFILIIFNEMLDTYDDVLIKYLLFNKEKRYSPEEKTPLRLLQQSLQNKKSFVSQLYKKRNV